MNLSNYLEYLKRAYTYVDMPLYIPNLSQEEKREIYYWAVGIFSYEMNTLEDAMYIAEHTCLN